MVLMRENRTFGLARGSGVGPNRTGRKKGNLSADAGWLGGKGSRCGLNEEGGWRILSFGSRF